eukprot:NODE_2698_length_892_cov_194.659498.p2 GENE.NODE_2698_length_892_cov_194.659498~~NODE_2698_length_892_cov_194.659498.p2  ORF type:complete len:103 (+),score=28.71 NODE_2698_length_892_cov_194.659498:48-311(+)
MFSGLRSRPFGKTPSVSPPPAGPFSVPWKNAKRQNWGELGDGVFMGAPLLTLSASAFATTVPSGFRVGLGSEAPCELLEARLSSGRR